MTSGALLALSLALLLGGGALALWALSTQRANSASMQSFIDRRAAGSATRTPQAVTRRVAAQTHTGFHGAVDDFLNRAGLPVTPATYVLLVAPAVVASLIAALLGGALAGLIVLAMFATMTYFVVWMKAERQRRAMVSQMPGLIDAMVRLITIGNSVQSAFQSAIPNVGLPLREALEHSSRLLRAGMDLDQALFQMARIYRVEELTLFAAVIRMSTKYGGRADVVLERMAHFMRDREEAERELIALSAETRMSAWVLGLLPVVVGLMIAVLNANYLATMWFDDTGRKLMLGALGLQAAGAYALYRLAKLT